jgi:hypothetical protein
METPETNIGSIIEKTIESISFIGMFLIERNYSNDYDLGRIIRKSRPKDNQEWKNIIENFGLDYTNSHNDYELGSAVRKYVHNFSL